MTSTLAATARSLIPDELLEPYGVHASLTGGALIREAKPLRGRVVREALYPSPAIIRVHVGASEYPIQLRRLLIWQSAYEAIMAGIGRAKGFTSFLIHPNPTFFFRWRALGSSDVWTDVPGTHMGVSLSSTPSTVTSDARVIGQVIIKDFRLDPTSVYYDAGAADLPANDAEIEFFLIGTMPPDELHPVIIEGLTAGQVAKNVYDGIYSARDPLTGDPVPTGIRYDAAALALMTDVVRIRLDEPVEDAREWLQKHIYAPTGWAPALDSDGRISPISQVPPTVLTGLPVVHDAITDLQNSSAVWDGGQRIINLLRFTYYRDYSIGVPDPPPPDAGEERQNVIDELPIIVEFPDDESIQRNGEQVLELDGSCFRALGRDANATEEEEAPPTPTRRRRKAQKQLPPTVEPVVRPAPVPIPVDGQPEDEKGHQLFLWRVTYLIPRFRFGAPRCTVVVMREALPLLRVGDWVAMLLSWFPDYVTGRRGTEDLCQVVAINDLDCAWRELTLERVPLPDES